MVTPSIETPCRVKVTRNRCKGAYALENFFAFVAEKDEINNWILPWSECEHFWQRIQSREIEVVLLGWGSIDPKRFDWRGLNVDIEVIPVLIEGAFLADYQRLQEFGRAQICIGSQPTSLTVDRILHEAIAMTRH